MMEKSKVKSQKIRGERQEARGNKQKAGIKRRDNLFMLCLAIIVIFLSGCTEKEKMYKESRVLMDTFCTITVVSPSKEKAQAAIDAGFAEIKRLETLLNYFSSDSEITAINKAAGTRPVKVSDDTMEIISKTYNISEATYGAFDATLAPVIKLWKFSKDPSRSSMPSGKEVEWALRLVDFKKIMIDRSASEVFLDEQGMEIDLGGIAKGYAADKAADAVKSTGINAALVAIAGDIRGFGANLSGEGWKVGIQNPRPAAESEKPWEDIFAVLQLKDKAISTSGDYQRFFIRDGKRYHHILDPGNGFPVESELISVSVVAPEGHLADGLSTAVFVLGAEKGMKLLESMGLDGVIVDADKNVILTKNLKENIKILNNAYQLQE